MPFRRRPTHRRTCTHEVGSWDKKARVCVSDRHDLTTTNTIVRCQIGTQLARIQAKSRNKLRQAGSSHLRLEQNISADVVGIILSSQRHHLGA